MNNNFFKIPFLFVILIFLASLFLSCGNSSELRLNKELLEEVKNNAEKYEDNKIVHTDEKNECSQHSYAFSYDSEFHYEKCISCGKVLSKEKHTRNENEVEYGITVFMNKIYYYKVFLCTKKCKLNVEYVPYFDFAQETSDD